MTAIPLQQHLHLAMAINDTPEYAPIWKWVAKDRLYTPQVMLVAERTLTGKLRFYPQMDAGGVVVHQPYKYTIKVQADFTFDMETRIGQLVSMLGKIAYLCDHYHAIDGADHRPTTKTVLVKNVGPFPPIGPGLPFFEVDVELEDASRQ